jgi:NAD(P)-dependent dehydrogenase (short-subunit alcohol dehydrogenase family)
VNATGVVQLGTIADVSVEEWDRVVDVNLTGTFLTCRAVIPHLEARGGGAIVNVASIAGRTKSSPVTHPGVSGTSQRAASPAGCRSARSIQSS